MQNQYILKHVKLKKKDIGNVYSGQRSAILTNFLKTFQICNAK